ncbi:MAG: copper resistance protein [Pseudomonadota bacterium]|nr:copper resistance protein [Pseudomonadota bacterium]
MKFYSSNKTLLSIAFFILSTASLPVFSHAIMVKSQPEENATLSVSPKQIDVWFNDKVGSEYKALAVIDSKGTRVDNKDVQQELLDASHLYCTIPTLPSGTYTIRYRVVSIDTHIVTGKFQFTIKTP